MFFNILSGIKKIEKTKNKKLKKTSILELHIDTGFFQDIIEFKRSKRK